MAKPSLTVFPLWSPINEILHFQCLLLQVSWSPPYSIPPSRLLSRIRYLERGAVRVLSEGALPLGSPQRSHRETVRFRAFFYRPSNSVVNKPPPLQVPQRGPNGESCLFAEPTFHILQDSHQMSPLSRSPSQSSHRKRRSVSRALHLSMKVPGKMSPLKFAPRGPYGESCPFPERSFAHLSESPINKDS